MNATALAAPDQQTKPPFCPEPHCEAHFEPPPERWWYRHGSYRTAVAGMVRRYRCKLCGRGFSEQTFDIDYFAKVHLPYPRIALELSSCVGVRAIGRLHGVDHKTVSNKLMRLARQAMAAEAMVWDTASLGEDLVADGIESFWVSQYFPNNLHVLVGADSQFVYGLNGATIRRSGRMTEQQKRRREALELRYRADPGAVRRSFGEMLDLVAALVHASDRRCTELRTDEHRAYSRAVRSNGAYQQLQLSGRIRHRTVPSSAPRTRWNPLFAANYIDRELRKDVAEHVRESTRFSRSVHGTFDRMHVYMFVHNTMKPFRIASRRSDRRNTHADRAGLDRQTIRDLRQRFFGPRAFLSRSAIRGPLLRHWLRMHTTPLQTKRAYLPAFMLA